MEHANWPGIYQFDADGAILCQVPKHDHLQGLMAGKHAIAQCDRVKCDWHGDDPKCGPQLIDGFTITFWEVTACHLFWQPNELNWCILVTSVSSGLDRSPLKQS